LVKGKVVRTFVNRKDVWSLAMGNPASGKTLTVRGTAEHPFYVQNQGWAPLGELREGDQLANASGETMIVFSKEHHPELVEVYNFEVEDAHTYFVGYSQEQSVLVHNDCPVCGGDRTITVQRHWFEVGLRNLGNIYSSDGGYIATVEVPCKCPKPPKTTYDVSNINSLGSSTLADLNRSINPNHTIHNEIRSNEQIADYYELAADSPKYAVMIGSFFIPGPEEVLLWKVLENKYTINLVKNSGGYVLKRFGKILKVGSKEFDETVKIVQSHVAVDLAKTVTPKYYRKLLGGKLECEECAVELIVALQKRGIKGNVVEIRANNGYSFIVSDTFGPKAISRGGGHYGVQVDGIVYDNIHINGIPRDEWLKDFHAPNGVSVKKIWDFESWLQWIK